MGKYPGYRKMSGNERSNARLTKTFEDAKENERKRVSEGHEPNPNLTSREDAAKHGWEHYKDGQYSRFRKIEKKKEMASKMTRADNVGSRKKDFNGGKQGNWMKVHKLDRN